MKVSNVIVLTVSLLVATAAIASQQYEQKLWVVIDDGTGNEGLFVKLDVNNVVSVFDEPRVADLKTQQAVAIDNIILANAITIISNEVLDDTTKEKIELVLSLSGHTQDIVFIDPNRISSKEVSATN